MSTKSSSRAILVKLFDLSIYKIGQKTNIPLSTLFRWNKGIDVFNIQTLKKLAHLKKVSVAHFFELYLKELDNLS